MEWLLKIRRAASAGFRQAGWHNSQGEHNWPRSYRRLWRIVPQGRTAAKHRGCMSVVISHPDEPICPYLFHPARQSDGMEGVNVDVVNQILDHSSAIDITAAVEPEHLAVGMGQGCVLFEPGKNKPLQVAT